MGWRAFARATAFAVLALVAASAPAQEKSAIKTGFTLQPGSARILLFRPHISTGSQSTAGMFEPNADWTAQARDNLRAALDEAQKKLGNEVILAEEPVGARAEALAEYQSLFDIVAQSVIEFKFFPGNRLPTKKREGVFDWTLGPGVAQLAEETGCRYGLFVITQDEFGSTGRKLFQLFAAIGGVGITSGVHKGFAGLVDLTTGELVWLNADLQMGGDVRTPEGAQRRVSQLLEDFPGRPAAQVAAAGPTLP